MVGRFVFLVEGAYCKCDCPMSRRIRQFWHVFSSETICTVKRAIFLTKKKFPYAKNIVDLNNPVEKFALEKNQ